MKEIKVTKSIKHNTTVNRYPKNHLSDFYNNINNRLLNIFLKPA